jgi:histidyl-tRNA synthetase
MDNETLRSVIKSSNIFPEDHKYLTFLKKVFRYEFRKNGFRRISTPLFEDGSFFEKIFSSKVSENVTSFKFGLENEV